MSEFVRLTLVSIQASDRQDLQEFVINRGSVSHRLGRPHGYTEVHVESGAPVVNVVETPSEILNMEPWHGAGPSRSGGAPG